VLLRQLAKQRTGLRVPVARFSFYQFRAACLDYILPHYARIDKCFEWLNILSCKLFWGWKADCEG